MSELGPRALRESADALRARGAELASIEPSRRAELLSRAAALLVDPDATLGRLARERLQASSGLSAPMVEWALQSTLKTASAPALIRLHGQATSAGGEGRALVSPGLVAVVLSGNVFTAPLRALLLPLLFGSPVFAKASSRDDVFPHLLQDALREVDQTLGAALEVVTFEGGDHALEDALFAQADVVSAYGSDTTLAQIRGRLSSTTTFIPHGHGLGAAFIPASALQDAASAEPLARALALDVAAYDQRGCLSPHALWVERGSAIDARAFAKLLSEVGLAERAKSLPRGPLPVAIGAQQVQWRGVGATRGALFEGDGYAVTYEGDAPFRISPGYRNLAVFDCDGPAHLARRLASLGRHLKCLGVAGDVEARRSLARSLPAPLAPRVTAIGEMQTPPIDALADGELPWAGLIQHIDAR